MSSLTLSKASDVRQGDVKINGVTIDVAKCGSTAGAAERELTEMRKSINALVLQQRLCITFTIVGLLLTAAVTLSAIAISKTDYSDSQSTSVQTADLTACAAIWEDYLAKDDRTITAMHNTGTQPVAAFPCGDAYRFKKEMMHDPQKSRGVSKVTVGHREFFYDFSASGAMQMLREDGTEGAFGFSEINPSGPYGPFEAICPVSEAECYEKPTHSCFIVEATSTAGRRQLSAARNVSSAHRQLNHPNLGCDFQSLGRREIGDPYNSLDYNCHNVLFYFEEHRDACADCGVDTVECFARSVSYGCRVLPPTAGEAGEPSVDAPNLAYDDCFGTPQVSTERDATEMRTRRWGGEKVLLTELAAGDLVLAGREGATPLFVDRVVVNAHKFEMEQQPRQMLRLHFETNGGASSSWGSVALSPDHILWSDGALRPAQDVGINSIVLDARGQEAIVRRIESFKDGYIDPLTVSGRMLVSDVQGAPIRATTVVSLHHMSEIAHVPMGLKYLSAKYTHAFQEWWERSTLLKLMLPVLAPLAPLCTLEVMLGHREPTIALTLAEVAYAPLYVDFILSLSMRRFTPSPDAIAVVVASVTTLASGMAWKMRTAAARAP